MSIHFLCAGDMIRRASVNLYLLARHRRLVAVWSCPQVRGSRQSSQCHTDWLLIRRADSAGVRGQREDELCCSVLDCG